MCTRARCFFARFNRLKLSAPLVEASPGHPELLGQLIDAHTGPHALYGHALKLPGISLSSLHSRFLSRRVCPSRVCHFKGSFHSPGSFRGIPIEELQAAASALCLARLQPSIQAVLLATTDRWHNRNFCPGRNSRRKSTGVTHILVGHKNIHVPSSFARFG